MLRALVPYLAYGYLVLVGLSARLKIIGEERRRRLRGADRRFIYAFWHEQQAFFCWTHRGDPLSMLVSQSRDGELIARTMALARMGAVRGSSSRGATAAVRALLAEVRAGRDLGITPDGPKGPRREVKPGAVFLARALGIPILPIANALSRKLVFTRSWDRYQLPLPFSRAVIRYGEPVFVAKHDDLAAKARELKDALDENSEAAQRALEAW